MRPSADGDNQLRTAAYEVLNSFVTNAAVGNLPIVATLSTVVLDRLANTISMRRQIVSADDRVTLDDMQTSLTSVLLVGYPSSTLGRALLTY